MPLLLRESGITLRRKRKLADHIELKLLWNYRQPWRERRAESWHSATLNSLFVNRSKAATTSRSRHSQNTSVIGLWIKPMFLRQLRYHIPQGIADRHFEAKSKTKNALANDAPRRNRKRENNIGIPNRERSISGEPYRQRHKARTSIDTAAERRIQAREQREPTMPPLKSGNPDNRPRSRPQLVYDNCRQRRSVHKASLSSKSHSKEATNRIKQKPSIHHEPTAEQSFLLKKSKRSN